MDIVTGKQRNVQGEVLTDIGKTVEDGIVHSDTETRDGTL